jgi:hypothetical protein
MGWLGMWWDDHGMGWLWCGLDMGWAGYGWGRPWIGLAIGWDANMMNGHGLAWPCGGLA